MTGTIDREVERLTQMTVKHLRQRYSELFDDHTNSGSKPWLIKRIAWRMQMLSEGGLSQRGRQRARELANEAHLRMTPPSSKERNTPAPERTVATTLSEPADKRLPPAGTILTRKYKTKTVQVRVLSDGFEFNGEVYRSLSAAAKAITGSHINGFRFFRLDQETSK